jgi:predicted small lipoprotein YifL
MKSILNSVKVLFTLYSVQACSTGQVGPPTVFQDVHL